MKVIQKKICLLGDFAVGKTSLVRRFVEERFDDKYLSTIGVKISRKQLARDGYLLNLFIWDLAGGEDFAQPEASYLRGAAGALIVCDVTRSETLGIVQRYANEMRRINPAAVLVVAGNKVDLSAEQVIMDADLQSFCAVLNAPYLLTSAKTGANANAAFAQLATGIEKQAMGSAP